MEMWKSHNTRFPHLDSPNLNLKSTYKAAEDAEKIHKGFFCALCVLCGENLVFYGA